MKVGLDGWSLLLTLVLPVTYMTVGNTPIGGVAAARQPSNDVHGNPVYDSDPTYVAFATYEGTTIVMDTREPEAPIEANRERSELYRVWSCKTG